MTQNILKHLIRSVYVSITPISLAKAIQANFLTVDTWQQYLLWPVYEMFPTNPYAEG